LLTASKINLSYQKHSLLRHVFAIYGNLPQTAKQVFTAYHSFHTDTSDILILAVLSANVDLSCNYFLQAVHRQVPILIRTIGSSSDLLGIISDPPADCSDLLMQVQVVLLTFVCFLRHVLFSWSNHLTDAFKRGFMFYIRLYSCIRCLFITNEIAPCRFYKPSLMLRFHPKI